MSTQDSLSLVLRLAWHNTWIRLVIHHMALIPTWCTARIRLAVQELLCQIYLTATWQFALEWDGLVFPAMS